jgi:hypothetical protein
MIVEPRAPAHNGKVRPNRPLLSECEQRTRVLELTVELLIARCSLADYWVEGFQDAARLLAAVPLTTADFGSASGHLQNAIAYCQQQEFGAAVFELRATRGRLQRL